MHTGVSMQMHQIDQSGEILECQVQFRGYLMFVVVLGNGRKAIIESHFMGEKKKNLVIDFV